MNIKNFLAGLIWVIAIALGILAVFKIAQNIEVSIGFITISFGILAVIWTFIARQNLSKGSALRDYTTSFLLCLIFILLFSIWHTFEVMLLLEGWIVMPEYLFITIAYLIFAFASYKIWKIGKEFGFKDEVKEIDRIIKEKKELKNSKRKQLQKH